MKYLVDFLVVEEGGIVLFDHSTPSGQIKDAALFAGFLEAITTFFQMSLHDIIVDINGENVRISFFPYNSLLFVGIAKIKTPKSSCTKELRGLALKFIEQFKERLADLLEDDRSIYQEFRRTI